MARRRVQTARVAPSRGTGPWRTAVVVAALLAAIWLAGRGGLLTSASTHHPAVHSTAHRTAKHK
jgi:hypothetical protein